MPRIRILLVEDHEDFSKMLCSLLEEQTECQVVARASNGLEALAKAEDLYPDLVLLDLGLPGLNGMEVVRRIRKLCPDAKVLVVSQESLPEIVQATLHAGANGYLLKSNAAELPRAIEALMLNKEFVSCRG